MHSRPFYQQLQDNTYILKYLQIKGGNVEYFVLIIAAIIVLVILMSYLPKITRQISEKKREKQDISRFGFLCQKYHLSLEEIQFLKRSFERYRLPKRTLLLRNRTVFDKYMAREMERVLNKAVRVKEHQNDVITELRRKLHFQGSENLEEFTHTRQIPKESPVKVTSGLPGLEQSFYGKIFDVDEERVLISVPGDFMDEEPLRIHQEVILKVNHKDDAEYSFTSVIDHINQSTPATIGIRHSHIFTRVPKRKYPRLDVQLPCKYFVLNHFQQKEFRERRMVTIRKDAKYSQGIITNISGGGCCFHLPFEYQKTTLIWIAVCLDEPHYELRNIVGSVTRTEQINDDEYSIMLHFTKIKDIHRDLIMRYVFKRLSEGKNLEISEPV